MRLEDYQKWLDEQFVDEEEPADAPGAGEEIPASVAVVEYQNPDPSARSAATAVRPHPAVPEAEAPPRPPAPPAPPAVVYDAEVPTLDRYLPFLRREPVDEPAAPPANGEPLAAGAAAAQLSEQPETLEAPAAPVREEPPAVEDVEPLCPAPQPEAPAQPAAVAAPPRPGIRSNMRLTEQAPPLTATELWALVPRHIQTLVGLGTDEVAQHSYKRAFRESRMELISRLLDPTLSLEETARLLNVCPTTVRRYTNRGLLRHQRTPGDQRRFRLSDVLAFLESQSRGPDHA